MGMIGTLDISGLMSLAPRLWPMGIGAGRPRAIELVQGVGSLVELSWDEAGHLIEVRRSIPPGPVTTREVYVWRDDELDRIVQYESDVADVFGDEFASEQVWTWAHGRPVTVRSPSKIGKEGPREDWEWSADGSSLKTTESSWHGVLVQRAFTFDASGHMVHSETEHTIDGARLIVDVTWSTDGRILEARGRSGPALEHELVVGFRWSGDGRLIVQSSGGVDLARYLYDAR